ncbi:hypothetical protein QBC47DRAFT_417605 [Echria macrotheca]|uniref:Heterokaryon incompatibility domain-containing protein n=1 Tax=Echria macrotheca TaxID=438768 RepID=A0AAJ0B6P7_9PEZI|nr:hypothetical protein QBC47DRAFT_417605 [Echria macrotheca]
MTIQEQLPNPDILGDEFRHVQLQETIQDVTSVSPSLPPDAPRIQPKVLGSNDTFRYQPLNPETPCFRLLRLLAGAVDEIACEIFQATLHTQALEAVPYEALSYTWGSPDRVLGITVNGKRMLIPPSLYTALNYLRLPDRDRVIWVDAICIDQDNMNERGHQVQHMGNIYTHAERVIVWLGAPTNEANLLMDCLADLEEEDARRPSAESKWKLRYLRMSELLNSFLSKSDTPHKLRDHLRDGLESLLERSWFRRVWILQEVANARAALVCCGTRAILARTMAIAPRLLHITPNFHCQAVLDIMPGPSRMNSWWWKRRELSVLLDRFSESEASDPRDKIYALLGLSSDVKNSSGAYVITPDYHKTVAEVVADVIRFLFNFDPPGGTDAMSHLTSAKVQVTTVPGLISGLRDGSITGAIFQAIAPTCGSKEAMLLLRRGPVRITEGIIRAVALNKMEGNVLLELLLRPPLARGGELTAERARAGFNRNFDDRFLSAQDEANPISSRVARGLFNWFVSGSRDAAGLMSACLIEGDRIAILHLLRLKIDVNLVDSSGMAPLNYAVSCQDKIRAKIVESMEKAVSLGLGLIKSVRGMSHAEKSAFLAVSARKVHLDVVRWLLEHGGAPNEPFFWNAFETALKNGNDDLALMLLENSVDGDPRVDLRQKELLIDLAFPRPSHQPCVPLVKLMLERWTIKSERRSLALDKAVRQGSTELVKVFLATRRKTTSPTEEEMEQQQSAAEETTSPLIIATKRRHYAAVKFLLAASDVNVETQGETWTPLSLAAYTGHEDVAHLLLDSGADMEASGRNGLKPLNAAACKGHTAMVKLLLDRGAHPDQTDTLLGRTPLSFACEHGFDEIVEILLSLPVVNPNSRDSFHRTPLMYAASGGRKNKAILKMLLLAREETEPDAKDFYGSTPLSIAVRKGCTQAVQTLLATGRVDCDAKDKFGRSPLSWVRLLSLPVLERIIRAYAEKMGVTLDEEGDAILARKGSAATGAITAGAAGWCDVFSTG